MLNWISGYDLNLFNWIKQKTSFTHNQIWTDFGDLYPFVQISPDETGQKFNRNMSWILRKVQPSYWSFNFRWPRPNLSAYLLRSATVGTFHNNRWYSSVNGTSWVLKSVNLFKLLFQTKNHLVWVWDEQIRMTRLDDWFETHLSDLKRVSSECRQRPSKAFNLTFMVYLKIIFFSDVLKILPI